MITRLRSLPWMLFVASAAALAASRPNPAPGPVLPFIDDDYEKALSLAKQKKLPIFVEAWAPW